MSSSKGPGIFSDLGKKPRDLLIKDYNTDQKISINTSAQCGVGIGCSVANKGGLSTGDFATQYKYKNAQVDAKVDMESNILTTITVTDLPAFSKAIASIKYPDYNSGKLEAQYLHQHAAITAAVGLKQSPGIDFSASFGTPNIAFGLETTYLTGSGEFAKYNAGVSFTKPNSNALIVLADKGDSVKFSYLHQFEKLNNGAVVGEVARKFSTNENTVTVGCSYNVDPHTLIKAKLNNHGNLGALLQHEVNPKSYLTISAAIDAKALEKTPKLGLALSLKP